MVKTVPPEAYAEIGDALGIRRNGMLILDSMEMPSVLADCCLYDWFEDGKNLVQRYAEAHPAIPGSDEAYLLNAYRHTRYGILTIRSVVPDAGLFVDDILNQEELFIMDQSFSRSLGKGSAVLATRTVPLGEFWMTGGAALPVLSADALEPTLIQADKLLARDSMNGPRAFTTAIVRACLDAGAAEHVVYTGTESRIRDRPRMPRWPGSKRHHR